MVLFQQQRQALHELNMLRYYSNRVHVIPVISAVLNDTAVNAPVHNLTAAQQDVRVPSKIVYKGH